MTAPLGFPALAGERIGTNASVLPVSGGAFEDLARPQEEEAEDPFFGSAIEARDGFQAFAEAPAPDWRHLYGPTPPVFRNEKNRVMIV